MRGWGANGALLYGVYLSFLILAGHSIGGLVPAQHHLKDKALKLPCGKIKF